MSLYYMIYAYTYMSCINIIYLDENTFEQVNQHSIVKFSKVAGIAFQGINK